MPLLLEELTRPAVQDYLEHDDRLILVIGSTEQHGCHLPLSSDVVVPWEIARRLSDRTGVLVAPAVPYGMSLHHMGFAGTLSLRPMTLTAVIADLLESAHEHGFHRTLMLNGHGGNIAAIQVALAEVLNDLPDLEVRLCNWWREPAIKALMNSAFPGRAGGHADASETSAVMAVQPGCVHIEEAAYDPTPEEPAFLTRRVFQERFPHGVIGADPRLASAELGEQIVVAAVELYEQILDLWSPSPYR